MRWTMLLVLLGMGSMAWAAAGEGAAAGLAAVEQQKVVTALVGRLGEAHRERIERGVRQAGFFWRAEDGTPEEFSAFCQAQFIAEPEKLDQTFARIERNLEVIWGHFSRMSRRLSEPLDLDSFAALPIDEFFGKYAPSSHFDEDFFRQKTAFVFLLNFPQTDLATKLRDGPAWTRAQWAQTRLADAFQTRIPADLLQKISEAQVEADTYINDYYLHCGNLVGTDGLPLFPPGLKLISHWGLRDELKAQYSQSGGLERQEVLYKVMERVVDGSIPREVIDNASVTWDPLQNKVYGTGSGSRTEIAGQPEADRRYAVFLRTVEAQKAIDGFFLNDRTVIDRTFNLGRQIPERTVVAALEAVLTSDCAARTARLIGRRLNRPLRPFDIWFAGFKPGSSIPEATLDETVRQRYPGVASFQADLPGILGRLGFASDTIAFLTAHIQADPSRGAGHAMGPSDREDRARLRTKILPEGMNFKGFDIAIHEFGHTVEQVFSLHRAGNYLLGGIPNSALTEAFAFVFQDRARELLGQSRPSPEDEAMQVLHTFWSTWEIAGVALAEIKLWHWIYDHPGAPAVELRQAAMNAAREVWNTYYAPVLGCGESTILAVYSHQLTNTLYLADYPLGHMIAFQIERFLQGKNLAVEMERMCSAGAVTPRLWMEKAVGADISPEPLLQATREALDRLGGK